MFFKKKKLNSLASEAYRTARINLQYILKRENARSVLVTSAEKGDGKTTVIRNLALSFASINKSVLIIDCDFRTCKLSEMFNLENEPGIADVILQKKELNSVIRKYENQISVLSAGILRMTQTKL